MDFFPQYVDFFQRPLTPFIAMHRCNLHDLSSLTSKFLIQIKSKKNEIFTFTRSHTVLFIRWRCLNSSLYKKAIADGMPALAISDHGNMFGVFDFVSQAYKNVDAAGKPIVKPIVGCEFYVAANRHRRSFTKEEKDQRFHQILLAKNEKGYKNLVKLTSLGIWRVCTESIRALIRN
jgi:DNA polymerase III alpha subunit (gram-positive type)